MTGQTGAQTRVDFVAVPMPANIEIKAKLKDRMAVEAVAARLSNAAPQSIQQEDIFFKCEGARLKLRIFGPDKGELIRYERANTPGPRRSSYLIARTPDPSILLEILTATLGRIGMVKKTRVLYLIGQTRVHIDHVEGLGEFLELEVVLKPGQSEKEGESIAEALLCQFEVDTRELIGEAYVDLAADAAALSVARGPVNCVGQSS
jgi:predicted adenylyl cyclase CyaB